MVPFKAAAYLIFYSFFHLFFFFWGGGGGGGGRGGVKVGGWGHGRWGNRVFEVRVWRGSYIPPKTSHVVPTSFIACWDYLVDAVYGEENGHLSALDKGTPLFII